MERTPIHPPPLPEPPQRHTAYAFIAACAAVFAGVGLLAVAAAVVLNSFVNSIRFG